MILQSFSYVKSIKYASGKQYGGIIYIWKSISKLGSSVQNCKKDAFLVWLFSQTGNTFSPTAFHFQSCMLTFIKRANLLFNPMFSPLCSRKKNLAL